MKRILRYIYAAVVALTAGVLLSDCNVHEWPELEYGEVPFVLRLDFDTSLPLYRTVNYTRGEVISRVSPADCDIRYIVNVYRAGETRNTGTAGRRYVFTKPFSEDLDYTATIALDEGDWEIYAWADYVDAGSNSDKYYDTSDFGNIVYRDKDNYGGSNDCNDAFRGSTSVTVIHPDRFFEDESLPSYEATVPMMRPLGRFEFIATDVDAFLTRVAAVRSQSAKAADARSIDVSEFRVVFRYNAFMPSAFNIFTDLPSDSWTGVWFDSGMALRNDGEMLMGFDYVLVNATDGTVMNLDVEIYDPDGSLLSVTRGVEVPIVRSKLTIVKGEFLTSTESGGVTVIPDFEGPDYNLEIQ